MRLGKFFDLVFFDVNVVAASLDALNIHLPDFESRFAVELWVIEAYVNTRLECFIEFADAIGRQDQNP